MNCEQINNKLIFFIEKSLPDAEMQEINSHIDNCNDCKKLTIQLESSLNVIEEEKKVVVNPFIHTGILQKIKNRREQPSFANIFMLKRAMQPVFYSMILVVGIGLGITFGNMAIDNANKNLANNDFDEIFFNDLDQEPIEAFLLNYNE